MKTVKNFMKKRVLNVYTNTSLAEIWGLIFKKGIHALPVIDKQHKLLGIISEEDLLSRVYPDYSELLIDIDHFDLSNLERRLKKLKKLTAKELMSKIVYTTQDDVSIFLALSKMLMLHVRQLPVVNKKNQVIGMITKGDLFDYIFRHYLFSP